MAITRKPTLLQTLFNQPSQKYASTIVPVVPKRPCSSKPTTSTPHTHPALAYASEKLTAIRPSADISALVANSASDVDSVDDDMFFTPRSSPVTPQNTWSSSTSPTDPTSSVEDETDDDLFSSRSATTSVTSFSVPSSKHDIQDPDSPRKSRSRPRSNPNVADWSRDVRWLVPPESARSTSYRSTASIIRSLDLVDVEYDPGPRCKSRSKSVRTIRPSQSERMSALVEEDEDDDYALPAVQSRPRSAPTLPSRHTHSASLYSRAPSTSRTVSIPSPLPVSAGTAPSTGYTSLTLPRAAYTPSKARVSTSVDITRSGLAQTTMATISITARPRPATPAHLRATLPSPLAFSAHTSPPGKVRAREILVQVWAVALDPLDALIVDERGSRNDGFGFVPGRSFVGRAIECGWEVNTVARGDWVVGITDMRKCGALAEFIVVDRRRIHCVPRPSSELTLEQLAALPLAGVPAHRAVRTLAHLPRNARALVLHAHDGAGLLATQELSALGVRVIAQVPGTWGSSAEKRARTAGAPDVRCGDAHEIVQDIPPAELDGVLDTLGGKPMWDACRRVLRPAGQFTTLVGDTQAGGPRVSVHAHFWSTMRSLRRAFAQRVGYQWVSPAADVDCEGADVRDSLAAVVRLAAEGVYAPHVERVLPLERAPDAFALEPDTQRCAPGTTVVRIVD